MDTMAGIKKVRRYLFYALLLARSECVQFTQMIQLRNPNRQLKRYCTLV